MKSSRTPPSRGRGRRAAQPTTRVGGPPSTNLRGGRTRNNTQNDRDSRMEHIASVSRSSGLEKDGDQLKERAVQEEFRAFIEKKLRTFWDLYGAGFPTIPQTESAQRQRKDNEENILILFRKLREGLYASGRKDGFALEVYETSLYLSVVFDSPVQTTSILSHLVPHMYLASPAPQPFRLTTVLVLLLHHLFVSFPSQQPYLEQMKSISSHFLEQPSAAYLKSWISALARSLRTLNFVHFETLSHPDAFDHLLASSRPSNVTVAQDLPRNAVHALMSRLRLKARNVAWVVIRNAYRELSSSAETQVWLGRRLFFDSFGCEATVVRFDEWIRDKCRDGHLRLKEGVDGKWMVCKAK